MLELHLNWAVIVVQGPFDDWLLLCIISLVLYAVADIDKAGEMDAYLRNTPKGTTPKGTCSFQCFGHDTDNRPKA